MRQDYAECERRVLLSEGGYTNDPRDPGGPTNWGITIHDARAYWKPNATAEDVRAMPKDVAVRIYKTKYWDTIEGDSLPPGVDYAVFDYGVNSGIGRAGRVLRAVLGLPHSDWHIDAGVLEALTKVDHTHVVNAICDERLHFVRGLSTFDHFGPGWTRRIAGVRLFSDHLAAEDPGVPPSHPVQTGGRAPGDDAPIGPTHVGTVPASGPQGSPPVSSTDTPATPVAPAPKAHWWMPWAGVGLGGSGFFEWFDHLEGYMDRFWELKDKLSDHHITEAFSWFLTHPGAYLPLALIAAGAWLWEEHKNTQRLITELEQHNAHNGS